MFWKRLKLFKLRGVPLYLDFTWFIIVVLIAWSLAEMVFPRFLPGESTGTYWAMGFIGAVGLFVCVLLHEFGHVLVGQRFGVNTKSVTLFIFGGVAEMDDDPPSPNAELWVALGGPFVTAALIVVFLLAALLPVSDPVQVVLIYLFALNAVLFGFNLIPAFPLDGGRVARAVLWRWRGNLRWATRITSTLGKGLAFLLMVFAAMALFSGDIVGAIWWFLLGMFLMHAANSGYRQLIWRQLLSGHEVSEFMNPKALTVDPDLPVNEFVEDYVYRHHFRMFPAVRDGKLIGCVNIDALRDLPREEWNDHKVEELSEPCSDVNTIAAEADASDALTKMAKNDRSRLMVVREGKLAGIVGLRDLLTYVGRRIEFEGETAT